MGHWYRPCLRTIWRGFTLLAIDSHPIWVGTYGSTLFTNHAFSKYHRRHPSSARSKNSGYPPCASLGLCNLPSLINKLIISRVDWQAIEGYVGKHIPLEACGLLAGKNAKVEKVLEIRNQAQSPVRFVMDPREQLDAFEWIDSNQFELLGIFHSHPAGPETLSATDIAEAAYPVVHIVCSFKEGKWSARGFWIEEGQTTEVNLEFI